MTLTPGGQAYTEAVLDLTAIGDDPCVADHVRCVGNSDRAQAPFASDVDLLCDLDGVIDLDAVFLNGYVVPIEAPRSAPNVDPSIA